MAVYTVSLALQWIVAVLPTPPLYSNVRSLESVF